VDDRALLSAITTLETLGSKDDAWQLSQLLPVVGEEGKARELDLDRSLLRHGRPPAVSAKPRPWREAFDDIARRHRVVVVMEAHNVSEHREFVRRLLPLFARADCRRYAAEAFSNFPGGGTTGSVVRGYPSLDTGHYIRDPRFGNVIRDALKLGFQLVAYEGSTKPFSREIAAREEFQANALAAALRDAPEGRLLVHCGYAHSFKRAVGDREDDKWMAARLWEKTGVEPFTVWQLSSGSSLEKSSGDYRRLFEAAGEAKEPVVFMPVPDGLYDPSFRELPGGGKGNDALVLHPPLTGAEDPAARPSWLKAEDRRRLVGTVRGGPRPLLVVARVRGEPRDAVPLDQILLRERNEAFELFLPEGPVDVTVEGTDGPLGAKVVEREGALEIAVGP
jgi:hypothetical protein